MLNKACVARILHERDPIPHDPKVEAGGRIGLAVGSLRGLGDRFSPCAPGGVGVARADQCPPPRRDRTDPAQRSRACPTMATSSELRQGGRLRR